MVFINDSEDVMKCEGSVMVKLSRLNMKSRRHHKDSQCLDLIHSNLCSFSSKLMQSSKYKMTLIDEFLHFGVVSFLKSKDQFF